MGEDDGSHVAVGLRQEIAAVDTALALLTHGHFFQAQTAFLDLQQTTAVAAPTRSHGYHFLAETAGAYSRSPVPQDWDGTVVLLGK